MSDEDNKVLQEEELEVLRSIYDGDQAFSAQSDSAFQYKYGDDGASRSFILELKWGSEYPSAPPDVSLDAFYNRHLVAEVKARVADEVAKEAESMVGMSMTYTLFEFVKEKLDELLEGQPETLEAATAASDRLEALKIEDKPADTAAPKTKKEQLTKAQKRAAFKKAGVYGEEKPRGWDWIDVVKHLSQTGGQKS